MDGDAPAVDGLAALWRAVDEGRVRVEVRRTRAELWWVGTLLLPGLAAAAIVLVAQAGLAAAVLLLPSGWGLARRFAFGTDAARIALLRSDPVAFRYAWITGQARLRRLSGGEGVARIAAHPVDWGAWLAAAARQSEVGLTSPRSIRKAVSTIGFSRSGLLSLISTASPGSASRRRNNASP
jgi:hypothetical protein